MAGPGRADGKWLASWAAVLAAAVVLTGLASAHDRLPGDVQTARRVQALPGAFAPLFESCRAATGTEVAVVLGAALATAHLLQRRFRRAIVIGAVLATLPLLQGGLKDLVDRPRPDPLLVERRAGFSSSSFPAGHVMSGTAVLVLVAVAPPVAAGSKGRAGLAAVVAAASGLNGVANVSEGVHWPSDVVGGYLWAAVLLIPAAWALRDEEAGRG